MARLAPDGDTYQAGTLSGNPVAMAAGLATLDVLERESGWQQLEARGAELEQLLEPVLARARFPVHLVRMGSLFWMSLARATARRDRGSARRAASRGASPRCSTPCWIAACICRPRPTRPASSRSPIAMLTSQRFAAALAAVAQRQRMSGPP